MPTFTPNLNLKKPLKSENYNVDDFNGNCDLIDEYITENKQNKLIAGKNIALTENLDKTTTISTVGLQENSWVKNKLYTIGDIVYPSNYPSSSKLECIVTGVSGNSEPSINPVGTEFLDGMAKWVVTPVSFSNYNSILKVKDVVSKGPLTNPKAFGAKFDGKTDDSIALQLAFDYSDNIILPSGISVFSATLNIKHTTTIRGANEYKSTLKYTGNGIALNCLGGYNNFYDFALQSDVITPLYFKAGTKGVSSSEVGVSFSMTNVRLQGFEVLITGIGYYWKFFRCSFYNSKTSFYNVSPNNLSFFGCNFNFGIDFIKANPGDGPISFLCCSFEAWSGNVVSDVNGAELQVSMIGCYVENYPQINNDGTGLPQFNGAAVISGQFNAITFVGNTVQCKGIRRIIYSTIQGVVNSTGNTFKYESGVSLSSTESFYNIVGGTNFNGNDKAIPYPSNYGYGTYTTSGEGIVYVGSKITGYNPITKKPFQTGWTTLPLSNGWANTGVENFPIMSAKVDSNGTLYLRGQITGISATSNIIATLPTDITSQLSLNSPYSIGIMITTSGELTRSFRLLKDFRILINGSYNLNLDIPYVSFPINS